MGLLTNIACKVTKFCLIMKVKNDIFRILFVVIIIKGYQPLHKRIANSGEFALNICSNPRNLLLLQRLFKTHKRL